MCKHQHRFGLDVQYSALVLNFNNIFSNGHLYRARQSMNSMPSQILERWRKFPETVKVSKSIIKNMANILTMRRLLGFNDFFPNENPREKEYYASKLGKEIIEKSTCFFLSFLRHKGTPDVHPLLQEWFTFYDFKWFKSPTYWQIDAEYRRIQNHHPGEEHSIISVESLLNMFLWVRDNNNVPDIIEKHDASSSLPLLELVLLFNDDILKNYEKATQSIAHYGDDRKMQRLILAGSFSQSDLINIDYAQLLILRFIKKQNS